MRAIFNFPFMLNQGNYPFSKTGRIIFFGQKLQVIERAFYFHFSHVGNMGIDFGGFHRTMAEQLLDVPDIGTILEEMRREAMP